MFQVIPGMSIREIWEMSAKEAFQYLGDETIDLIYIDPPFNTGKTRKGRYGLSFPDDFGSTREYLDWLTEHLTEAYRLLTATGSIYVHSDPRISHLVRLRMERVFGRACFINEIVWAYDYGGRPKRAWPRKHDYILFFVVDPDYYYFSQDNIDRIPYMAPGLAGPEKAAKGKLPTDVWWHTIVHTTGSERTGYPTQKPVALLKRIIQASCPPDGLVLDFFAGSGTTGEAADSLGISYIMVDNNPQATGIMSERLGIPITYYGDFQG